MNGQDAGEEHAVRFNKWAESKTEADFRAIARGGKLARTEVIKECGFSRSVLSQNPAVRQQLQALECDLRARGILAQISTVAVGEDGVDEPEPLRQQGQIDAIATSARVKALEQRIQVLNAENAELRKRITRFSKIEEVLTSTGRMAR